jgi:hypothetical protein
LSDKEPTHAELGFTSLPVWNPRMPGSLAVYFERERDERERERDREKREEGRWIL